MGPIRARNKTKHLYVNAELDSRPDSCHRTVQRGSGDGWSWTSSTLCFPITVTRSTSGLNDAAPPASKQTQPVTPAPTAAKKRTQNTKQQHSVPRSFQRDKIKENTSVSLGERRSLGIHLNSFSRVLLLPLLPLLPLQGVMTTSRTFGTKKQQVRHDGLSR